MKTWQKVILRNYGIIDLNKIAYLLETDGSVVKTEAERMGLKKLEKVNPDWISKGFVTVIRNNFDLLNLDQIAFVLDMGVKELKQLLVEYDFLDVKLGEQPPLQNIKYVPLNDEEISQTEEFARYLQAYIYEDVVKPFDFYSNRVAPVPFCGDKRLIKDTFASAYSADYSSALLDDELKDYPDEYFDWLMQAGVNGIWISETLKNLADFPFDRQYVGDYKKRVNNLRKLTERCHKHGVNVYLYLNEPRSMPEEFFINYPHLKGQKTNDGSYCLCTSVKEVQDYLYNAVKSLAESVPLLKGIMTITMSENPTHCKSIKWDGKSVDTSCPNCKDRPPEEITAEVNNVIARALKDGNGYTKLIANLWGWSGFMGWSEDMAYHGIDLLDDDVEVLCVSEYGKEFVCGGVKSQIIDYSISKVGPSDISVKMLGYAKNKGHKIWAKVQLNNSWECSAVPYLPTFDLMTEHVKNLKALDVDGLMLGWSLGGYPGGVLPLVSRICASENYDENLWYSQTYGDMSDKVVESAGIFSEAFRGFPFSIDSLYYGGHNLGCGNLWSLEASNRISTMVCFTFDDYENWTKPYGLKIYTEQLNKLNTKWEEGLKLIEGCNGNPAFEEFKRCALGGYVQFKSAENLSVFTQLKGDIKANKDKLILCLNSEEKLTQTLLKLMSEDAKIGFEMTNHYFYNKNLLLEKLVLIQELKKQVNKN